MDSKKEYTNVKILISYNEYERLKKIEEQFLHSQKSSSLNEKHLDGGKSYFRLKLNLLISY